MITNRPIWLFREPRSGSSQLASFLTVFVNRKYYFIESNLENRFSSGSYLETPTIPEESLGYFIPKYDDSEYLYNTHCFNLLQVVHRYSDPILVRCIRENTIDQFLSTSALKTPFRNIYTNQDESNDQLYQTFIKQKLILTKRSYINFLNNKKQDQNYWENFSRNHENYTITYEQMISGNIKIPVLGLDHKISGYTEQLPTEYKQNMFLNFEEVYEWDKEIKANHDTN